MVSPLDLASCYILTELEVWQKLKIFFFSIELSDGLNFGVFFFNLKTYTPANPIPLGSSDKNVEGGSRNNRDSVASDKVSKF